MKLNKGADRNNGTLSPGKRTKEDSAEAPDLKSPSGRTFQPAARLVTKALPTSQFRLEFNDSSTSIPAIPGRLQKVDTMNLNTESPMKLQIAV